MTVANFFESRKRKQKKAESQQGSQAPSSAKKKNVFPTPTSPKVDLTGAEREPVKKAESQQGSQTHSSSKKNSDDKNPSGQTDLGGSTFAAGDKRPRLEEFISFSVLRQHVKENKPLNEVIKASEGNTSLQVYFGWATTRVTIFTGQNQRPYIFFEHPYCRSSRAGRDL